MQSVKTAMNQSGELLIPVMISLMVSGLIISLVYCQKSQQQKLERLARKDDKIFKLKDMYSLSQMTNLTLLDDKLKMSSEMLKMKKLIDKLNFQKDVLESQVKK